MKHVLYFLTGFVVLGGFFTLVYNFIEYVGPVCLVLLLIVLTSLIVNLMYKFGKAMWEDLNEK